MNTWNENSPIENEGGMEERLWNFIDGLSQPEEKKLVEQLLQFNAAWKDKYNELLQVHDVLQSSAIDAPSMRFTKNVMEEISRQHIAPATKSYINNKIIWGLGIFFITMLIGFLVYGFGQMDLSSGKSYGITKNLDKIDFSKFFNNNWINAFMLVNVVIGLVLLDSYLSMKKKSFRRHL
jgi:magnesium-transporting ATPase (P-type)